MHCQRYLNLAVPHAALDQASGLQVGLDEGIVADNVGNALRPQ